MEEDHCPLDSRRGKQVLHISPNPSSRVVAINESEIDVHSFRRKLGKDARKQLMTVAGMERRIRKPFIGHLCASLDIKGVDSFAIRGD